MPATTSKSKKPAKANTKTVVFEKLPVLTQLTELSNWLATTQLEEVEVKQGDLRLRLKKPGTGQGVMLAPAIQTQAVTAAAPAAAPQTEATKNTLNAPMVGTFYCAPGPGASPFIAEGDIVSVGQVIGIIEAMKTMNQITAEKAGRVVQILVSNAQPVEYGQPLVVLS